ncbi:tRNA(Ser) Um(44) 2'-O-methyltransferase [Yamadazyma tenuis]|uniref:tRNA (uracil-O(2)-)-methyltransferase n=1 Tax=Candida tenuis (strain ATCC 10573 / BCRC 21748 / CBS 615 / JCM 9827 / NBRC 10315 / NRRL Y-1498 / VKM Y-70) TaxID=590646 RepID=G3B9V3_CANTC|nr:uncharacterized protein CANTEDRAFT_135908 [Yamadazyma tenuis ATCC 10573]EGV61974.1 hypothetical protein CANTEDRAFT_135908 [Yamadazyma tenuis ATCC 10573]WEJ93225.1 tRNA(Ser) Um(44) 2'-O-methyltransferase [Yamadazyma tenuis]
MKRRSKKDDGSSLTSTIKTHSILGDVWVPIYETPVEFSSSHFETAMLNIIKQPNINSTVIMRADILKENIYDPEKGDTMFVSKNIKTLPSFPDQDESDTLLYRNYDDVELRHIPLDDSAIKFKPKCQVVRRVIPRNPFKDYIINQTSVILSDDSNRSLMVVYIPHIEKEDETPFYLPPVHGIAILFHDDKLSIHYLPFNYTDPSERSKLRTLDPNERSIRIAMRLLLTSRKHSQGSKDGYEKRVVHDLVVPKEAFQNRYISLKKKYSSALVNSWAEKTDPKKHVFEDLAIAAFLIELWKLKYDGRPFEFMDLGCGNGLLVYILHMEGYKGRGIDARARKSWITYPAETQECLEEKIIIPHVLLKSNTQKDKYFQIPDSHDPTLMTYHSSSKLMASKNVCITNEFKENTFIIGNHSDELTCWIPLLGYSFLVIPCCSHSLSGAKKRYTPKSSGALSTYGALVEHVEELSKTMGWIVEKESLRIPSTRNAAVIGFNKHSKYKDDTQETFDSRVMDVANREKNLDSWVENSISLMKKAPRDH